MFATSSTVIYKMVRNDDGSANWVGIGIIATVFLAIFVWRCCLFVPEYSVATRKRFNRVVLEKNGMPREYDPLAERVGKPGKKVRTFRLRFYLVNSLVLTDCADRETELGIEGISVKGVDFDTSFAVPWTISREQGNPTKSFQRVAQPSWWRRQQKDELEEIVRKWTRDAVLMAYEKIEDSLSSDALPTRLPALKLEEDLAEVRDYLLEEYGVQLQGILCGQRSIALARRMFESASVIATALDKVADTILSSVAEPAPKDNDEDDGSARSLAAV